MKRLLTVLLVVAMTMTMALSVSAAEPVLNEETGITSIQLLSCDEKPSGKNAYSVDTTDKQEGEGSLSFRVGGGQVNEMVFGNTSLDLSTSMLMCDGKTVRLSAKEFDVMRLLLQAGKRNLSKSAILSHIWGLESNAVENHVEVYVAMLRKKLCSIGSDVKIISIRGLGYHLEVKEA